MCENEKHSKKKNLTQIRTEFYDKLTPNEDDKVYINDNDETLQKIFQLYKSISTMNKQRNSIEFNLEGLKTPLFKFTFQYGSTLII